MKTMILLTLISTSLFNQVLAEEKNPFVKIDFEAKFVMDRRGAEGTVQSSCWMISKDTKIQAKVEDNFCRKYVTKVLGHELIYNKKDPRGIGFFTGVFGNQQCFEEDHNPENNEVGKRWSVVVDMSFCEESAQQDQDGTSDIRIQW